MNSLSQKKFDASLRRRHLVGEIFRRLCQLSIAICLLILAVLLVLLLIKGWPLLHWRFLTRFDSTIFPARAGIKAGLWGSFWLILLTGLFAVPAGVGAAVYLEEYSKPTRLTRLIQLNIANLAGVPSIVYGILGLTVFVRMFGLFGAAPVDAIPSLPFGKKVLSGALTLSLLVLPVIIISAQEALRSIPKSIRYGSLALGATQWQTIRHQVLPAALPGIMTGVILALSRAAGETAPLIMIGALTFVHSTPGGIDSINDIARDPTALLQVPFDLFTCMPLTIYNWASQSQPVYRTLEAAGIVVLLVILLIMNAGAILIRHHFQKQIRW